MGKVRFLNFTVYLYIYMYFFTSWIEEYCGISGMLQKLISIGFLVYALILNKKRIRRVSIYHPVMIVVGSLSVLSVVQFFSFSQVLALHRVILGLFVFVFFSLWGWKDRMAVIEKSLLSIVLLANIICYVSYITGGDDFNREVWIIDKPFYTLLFSLTMPLSFLRIVQRRHIIFHLFLLVLSLLVDLQIIQSKLSLGAFGLFIILFFLLGIHKHYGLKLSRVLKIVIVPYICALIVFPQKAAPPDEFLELANKMAGEELFEIDKVEKEVNTYTMREAITLFSLAKFAESPIIGHGYGNFSLLTKHGETTFGEIEITEAESSYLGLLVEGGLWYFFSIIVLFLFLLIRIFKYLRRKVFTNGIVVSFCMLVPIVFICYGNDYIDSFFWFLMGAFYFESYINNMPSLRKNRIRRRQVKSGTGAMTGENSEKVAVDGAPSGMILKKE